MESTICLSLFTHTRYTHFPPPPPFTYLPLFLLPPSLSQRQVKKIAKRYGCNWTEIPNSEIIGRAVGEVAPSILLTGLSETSAFLLGAVSSMPAVRTFSLYAGTAVFFNLLLQLSVFVAVMALDSMRQLVSSLVHLSLPLPPSLTHSLPPSQRNRIDVVPCIALKGKFDPRVGMDYLSKFMKYFADFILFPITRPFILLIFGLTLTSSVILMTKIEVGLNQNLALPKVLYVHI